MVAVGNGRSAAHHGTARRADSSGSDSRIKPNAGIRQQRRRPRGQLLALLRSCIMAREKVFFFGIVITQRPRRRRSAPAHRAAAAAAAATTAHRRRACLAATADSCCAASPHPLEAPYGGGGSPSRRTSCAAAVRLAMSAPRRGRPHRIPFVVPPTPQKKIRNKCTSSVQKAPGRPRRHDAIPDAL